MAQRGLVFVVLLGLWIILSGQLDAFHLILGVLSCAFVTLISGDLMFAESGKSPARFFVESARFLVYAPWLIGEVFKANLQVLRLALVPGALREVRPQIVCYQTTLRSEYARFVFANSITLTPGTVTLDIEGNNLYVHAINQSMADGLGGEMERKIAWVFGEEGGKPVSEHTMETFFTVAAILILLFMLFPLYRVIVGPTAIDRIVAVNIIGTKTAVLLVVIGTIYERVDMFVDFALAYALLNFIGSIAASRYFFKSRPRAVELSEEMT